MADVDDSPLTEISDLSEAESLTTDEEIESGKLRGTLDKWFKTATSPPAKRKRPASPPHEYVPADDPAIAVIVMFRSRFTDVFPKSLPNYGPQDIERGVLGDIPEESIEKLLASLLGLCLNRKKDVEKGHYNRALEEAMTTFYRQWPSSWENKNPLAGGATFKTVPKEQRLSILLALVHWSLASSEAVRQVITESYKGSRDMQDKGQPLAVQPWGSDGEKRRYWLIEGLDDTFFRVYRENDPKLIKRTWWSVAQDIDSAKALADKLRDENSQAGKQLASGIDQAVPRWEAGDEKRKRREYRQLRKAQFTRPEPGFSLYEGRTRGKRLRYNFSEDESDEPSGKRSRTSGRSTPAELNGPVMTSSGRQVKARTGGMYGESLLSGQQGSTEIAASDAEDTRFRTRAGRSVGTGRLSRHPGFNEADHVDDESDEPSDQWDSDKNEDEDVDENLADVEDDEDEDEDMSDGDLDEEDAEIVLPSKIVRIKLSEETAARLASSPKGSSPPRSSMEIDPPQEEVQQPQLNAPTEEKDIQANGIPNGLEHKTINLTNGISETPLEKSAEPIPQLPIHMLVNGISKNSKSVFEGQPSPTSKNEVNNVQDISVKQTPTPPLSDIQQSAPESGNGSFVL